MQFTVRPENVNSSFTLFNSESIVFSGCFIYNNSLMNAAMRFDEYSGPVVCIVTAT